MQDDYEEEPKIFSSLVKLTKVEPFGEPILKGEIYIDSSNESIDNEDLVNAWLRFELELQSRKTREARKIFTVCRVEANILKLAAHIDVPLQTQPNSFSTNQKSIV